MVKIVFTFFITMILIFSASYGWSKCTKSEKFKVMKVMFKSALAALFAAILLIAFVILF